MTGFRLLANHADEQRRSEDTGVEGIVRLRAMCDDGIDRAHHEIRDIAVVIEAENDRYVRPEHLAAERGLFALDVVNALGRAGAMQLKCEAIDLARSLQARANAVEEELAQLAVDAPSGDGEGADDRDRLGLELRSA